jgi:hypothetical protein
MKSRIVYPVEGRFLMDVPAVEHECTDPRCIESGAFTEKPPRRAKPTTTEPVEQTGSSDSEDKE